MMKAFDRFLVASNGAVGFTNLGTGIDDAFSATLCVLNLFIFFIGFHELINRDKR